MKKFQLRVWYVVEAPSADEARQKVIENLEENDGPDGTETICVDNTDEIKEVTE